jgi:hypothetical protein
MFSTFIKFIVPRPQDDDDGTLKEIIIVPSFENIEVLVK